MHILLVIDSFSVLRITIQFPYCSALRAVRLDIIGRIDSEFQLMQSNKPSNLTYHSDKTDHCFHLVLISILNGFS